MPTFLDVLPARADSAAANMAADFLLLRRYPSAARGEASSAATRSSSPAASPARFRAYGWRRPAFSFGYSQKIAWVRLQLPAEAEGGRAVELVRRPTGGGLVDHRDDWTYALVIPRGHALEAARAVESYRAVHAALVAALLACGQPAVLKERCEPAASASSADAADADEGSDGNAGADAGEVGGASDEAGKAKARACAAAKGPTVCFLRPELYDVLHPDTGAKIAGAAQKRTKEGLLFQGSIWRPAAAAVGDWDEFQSVFVAELARTLGAEAREVPWPEFREDEVEALTEQYSAPEWNEAR